MDITLLRTGEHMLDVRVRPADHFDGVFSSVVFTLRWDAVTGIVLSPAIAPENAPLTITHSGQVTTNENAMYQVFAGFGFSSLSGNGDPWEAGQEYTILTIPFIGSGAIELMNDAFTTGRNGGYYVTLNGHDHTGLIYDHLSTTVDRTANDADPQLLAWPSPAIDVLNYSSSPEDVGGLLEVLDAAGRRVYNERLSASTGRIDITGLTSGTYLLRLTIGGQVRGFSFQKQ
ncbi:MAG: T9SS type A sorting domain-containing protein [Flavobacteriales bacterium]|nr:MAG: T9SS type A sorting domain-containing protein [Flavobacteriales bacterium]